MNSTAIKLDDALEGAKKHFFEGVENESTAYLYGSAVVGDWTPVRSDLDLIVFIDQGRLKHFYDQLVLWKKDGLPLIDGFLVFEDTSHLFALRLEDLYLGRPDSGGPLLERIFIPDLWNIQNRSKKLFGSSKGLSRLPIIGKTDLRRWAISNRDDYWIPLALEGIPKLSSLEPNTNKEIGPTIWAASGAARIANLILGGECISKLEALKIFLRMVPESHEQITFLIDNYFESDRDAVKFTAGRALEISKHCLTLLQRTKTLSIS